MNTHDEDAETWESGPLGHDESHVATLPASPELDAEIDEAVGLQAISIRLEKSLIEDFKLIASMHGLGYQPLMRQALKRFADCEKKRLLREVAAERGVRAKESKVESKPVRQKERKAA